MKKHVWLLVFALTLSSAVPAAAQVVVSARFGRPWRYCPPPRPYYGYGPRYYYPAPAVVAPPPVVVYPAPYYAPRPYYGRRGWRGWRRW